MKRAENLAGLARLTQIVLDRSLADLRAVAEGRNETLRLLAELDKAASSTITGATMASLQAEEMHRLWAAAMRARLVARLDQQTAIWQSRRAQASSALGRHQALNELKQAAR